MFCVCCRWIPQASTGPAARPEHLWEIERHGGGSGGRGDERLGAPCAPDAQRGRFAPALAEARGKIGSTFGGSKNGGENWEVIILAVSGWGVLYQSQKIKPFPFNPPLRR